MPDLAPVAPAQPASEPIDLTPREPTAPVAPATPKKALNELTEPERLTWRKTGDLPEATPAPAVAAPAPPAEEPRTVSKRQQQINDYERRIAEQDAELARLRTPPPPAAPRSAPRPESTTPPTLADTIARPDIRQAPITEAAFYEQHPDAGTGDYADYRASYRIVYTRAAEHRDRLAHESQQAEEARLAKARASLDAATTADPTFAAKVAPLTDVLQTREQAQAEGIRPGPEHDFSSAIVRSEVAAQILAHLADHPDVLRQVKALESRADVLTFFGRLEARFLDLDPPAAATPRPSTTTSAPDPPPMLGQRPGEPVDAVAGALKRRDTGAYIRAANARDLAAHRG